MKDYIGDPNEIYRQSFATVRRETILDHLPPDVARVAIRLVHACGMPEIVADLAWSGDVVPTARASLQAGAPVVTDVRMVEAGIIRERLPAANAVHTAIAEADVAVEAKKRNTTRAVVAMEKLAPLWADAVLVIGSAPTALFRVLEMVGEGAAPPAAILGFPVGFVGAAESKAELSSGGHGIPYLTLNGRRGGSAMAAAAINALASADDDG